MFTDRTFVLIERRCFDDEQYFHHVDRDIGHDNYHLNAPYPSTFIDHEEIDRPRWQYQLIYIDMCACVCVCVYVCMYICICQLYLEEQMCKTEYSSQ
jgi:hypothetical protein